MDLERVLFGAGMTVVLLFVLKRRAPHQNKPITGLPTISQAELERDVHALLASSGSINVLEWV